MSLVIVPTPLGNLRDITLRAVDELRACDLVVAEDTRVALRLLSALGITGKPIWSYREQNAATATAGILARAQSERVAVVSDAGMPAISDPGRDLVVAARAAGIAIEVLPGPSAFICAAVLSGFEPLGMAFEGFVPRQDGRRRDAFARALASGRTTVWYESPHRLVATLESLAALAPEARVFVARELTKRHEQQILATPAEALAALEQPVRGEIVLVLDAANAPSSQAGPGPTDDLESALARAIAAGEPAAAIAKRLAAEGYGERGALYARVVAARAQAGEPLRER